MSHVKKVQYVLCVIFAPFCSAFLFVPFADNNHLVRQCVGASESAKYVIFFAVSPVPDIRLYAIFVSTLLADRVATSPAPLSNNHL